MMLIYTSRKSECLVTVKTSYSYCKIISKNLKKILDRNVRGIYNKKATSKVAKKHDN